MTTGFYRCNFGREHRHPPKKAMVANYYCEYNSYSFVLSIVCKLNITNTNYSNYEQ